MFENISQFIPTSCGFAILFYFSTLLSCSFYVSVLKIENWPIIYTSP